MDDRLTDVDVVIVGGGLAGFSAALTAAQAGLDVTLIEKQRDIGGSSALSGGCLAFAGTDIQEKNGIADSDDLLYDDLISVGKSENDSELVRAYVDNQKATYAWLCEQGAEFSPVIETAAGQSVPRVHTVDPADLVRLLARRCAENGNVTLQYSCPALRLVRSSDTGRVTGVVYELDGEQATVSATRGVILASGGFCRSEELMHRFAPGYDGAFFIGGDGNQGDGLRMACRLGADFRDTPYINGTFGKHPTDTSNNHSCQAVYKGAIAVNQDGKRFVDESISYKLLGAACMKQPYAVAYQILDEDIFLSGDNRVRILDFERRLDDGLMIQADSLEQLAQMVEIDPVVLIDTVERYNGYVDEGNDPEFGRQHLVHEHGELRRIKKAPFYAYPSTVAVFGTYCGLCTDTDLTVLDVFGARIEGLRAVGELMGGFHGAAYMTGSALGKATVFGRLAANFVAEV